MPNRMIKESICYSDDIDKLSWFEEVVFYRLIVRCDDNGRLDARPPFLRSMLFATKQGVTEKSISDALYKLASVGLVSLYEAMGNRSCCFQNGTRISGCAMCGANTPPPGKSPPQAAAYCGTPPPQSQSESESQSEAEAQSLPHGENGPSLPRPMLEEVCAYCTQRNNQVDPQRFVDFYTAKAGKSAISPCGTGRRRYVPGNAGRRAGVRMTAQIKECGRMWSVCAVLWNAAASAAAVLQIPPEGFVRWSAAWWTAEKEAARSSEHPALTCLLQ